MAVKRSFDDIRQLVRAAVQSLMPQGSYCWTAEMYEDNCVYAVESSGGETKYFQVPYSIDDDDGVSLGESNEVRKRTEWETVVKSAQFDLGEVEELPDGSLVARAKVFHVGDFPDKNFSLSASEADEVIEAHQPAPIEIEHQESVFTKDDPFNIGELASLERVGNDIFGVFKFKSWVKSALKGQAPKFSLGWQRFPKKVVECSLVLNPRIPDAQLAAAFAESRKGTPTMNPWQKFLAALKGIGVNTDDLATFTEEVPSGTGGHQTGLTAEQVADIVKAQLAPFTAQLCNLTGEATEPQLETAVAAFEAWMKGTGKVMPTLFDAFKAQYKIALADDGGGKAVFAAGRPLEGERVASLKKLIEAMPDFKMKSDTVQGTVFVVSGESEVEFDAEKLSVDPVKVLTGKAKVTA